MSREKHKRLYRIDKFGRPIFKVMFSNGESYKASTSFTLNEMTKSLVQEFKKQIRHDFDKNYPYDENDEWVWITQIRFA